MRYELVRTGTTHTTLASDLLSSVKQYLGVPDTGQDSTVITPLIEDAIQFIEDQCGIVLALSDFAQYIDRFPMSATDPIELMKPPLISVTSITYTDDAGNNQTWSSDNYQADTTSWPGRVRPKPGYTYPVLALNRLHNVTVNFKAGSSTTAAMHPMARRCIMFLCSHWYHNREAAGSGAKVFPLAIQECLNNLRWPK